VNRRHTIVAGSAVLAVLSLGTGALIVASGDEKADATPIPVAVQAPAPVVVEASPEPEPTPTPKPEPACSTATKAFLPTKVEIAGIETISVLALPRDGFNIPGVPALTASGKNSMAFDLGSGIRPGDRAGNALLNAHTYPDGSALGNKLLAKLDKGDEIVVKGVGGQLCYEVNDRVEVSAYDRGKRYYAKTGKPQIAIIVCSGKRLGPGNWTERTIWYASPISG
jgi:hypothetical protein